MKRRAAPETLVPMGPQARKPERPVPLRVRRASGLADLAGWLLPKPEPLPPTPRERVKLERAAVRELRERQAALAREVAERHGLTERHVRGVMRGEYWRREP